MPLARLHTPLTLAFVFLSVLQGLFQEWPGNSTVRWVSWPVGVLASPSPCLPLSPGFLLQRLLRRDMRPSGLVLSRLSSPPGGKVPSGARPRSPSVLVHPGSGEWGESPCSQTCPLLQGLAAGGAEQRAPRGALLGPKGGVPCVAQRCECRGELTTRAPLGASSPAPLASVCGADSIPSAAVLTPLACVPLRPQWPVRM